MGLLGGFYVLRSLANFPDRSDYRYSKTQNLHIQNIFELNQDLPCKWKYPTDWETNVGQEFVDLVWGLYKKILRSLNPALDFVLMYTDTMAMKFTPPFYTCLEEIWLTGCAVCIWEIHSLKKEKKKPKPPPTKPHGTPQN